MKGKKEERKAAAGVEKEREKKGNKIKFQNSFTFLYKIQCDVVLWVSRRSTDVHLMP